jgi:hypothetical protein
MKWLALTRVFRLGSILKVCVPLALGLLAAGFWTGQQWQAGRQAQAELERVEGEIASQDQADEAARTESASFEQRRSERLRMGRITDAELRAFIADRPELWDCDIGDDGLRLIESWSAPLSPAAAESDGGLRGPAPTGQRPAARPADQPEGTD